MVGHYLAVIVIGFVAGLIARFIMPGPNNPSGFIMTTILGIVGSVLANFITAKLGYSSGEGVSLLSGIVGAIVILLVYHLIVRNTATTV